MTSDHTERNARGFERFLLFSDAIAAIAITLLILPLVDSVQESTEGGLSAADIVRDNRWEFFSFLLSFVVILSLWLAHQGVFNGVRWVDPPLMAAGMGWLLAIVFLPFTTALIANHADEQTTLVLYVANVAVAIYALTVSTWWLHRHPVDMHQHERVSAAHLAGSLRTSILITLALVVALVLPQVGFLVMLLLGLNKPLARLMARRTSR